MELPSHIREDIVRIVKQYPAVQKVLLFGSRASPLSQKSSDVDLALFGSQIRHQDLSLIHDALENEVKTALKFDVVHFESLSKKELKEEIMKEGICLYARETN